MIGFEIISQIENNFVEFENKFFGKIKNHQCLIYDVECHKAPY